jgi:GPI ethanolamine phosphate transferase 3 subunit O
MVEEMIGHAAVGGPHERTLLLIFGDHGQTLSGDHGGGSPEEVDSALVAINLHAASLAQLDVKPARHVAEGVESASSSGVRGTLEVVEQLDFAASLSALLGLPIPAENVGMLCTV